MICTSKMSNFLGAYQNMKRIFTAFLICLTVFCLVACSNSNKPHGIYVNSVNNSEMIFTNNTVIYEGGKKGSYTIKESGRLVIKKPGGGIDETYDYIAEEDKVVLFGGFATWYKK